MSASNGVGKRGQLFVLSILAQAQGLFTFVAATQAVVQGPAKEQAAESTHEGTWASQSLNNQSLGREGGVELVPANVT